MKNIKIYKLEIFSITLISLVLISPIFGIIKMASTFIALFIFLLYLYRLKYTKIKNYKLVLKVISSILITSAVPAIVHNQLQYLIISFFFLISLFIILQSNKFIILKFVEFASNFILILNICSIIGFIYAFVGGPPLLIFPNPNGLINYFYFTTMTNSVWGNFIRPSGIYDEPGAFSFFITGIATARHFLNLSTKKTWILLITGIITFSVAHIIYIFFYLLSKINFNFFKPNVIKNIFFITLGLIFVYIILLFSGALELIDLLFLSRFNSDNSGLFPGDNRSGFFFNAYDFISANPITLLFGQPINDSFSNIEYDYGNVGANPLMPILTWGIFASWPYYLILFFLIIQLRKGKYYFPSLGFALILCQREFIYVISYSMIIILIVTIIYFNNKNEEKNSNSFWY